MTEVEKKESSVKNIVSRVSMPTLIIGALFIAVVITGTFTGLPLHMTLTDVIYRFGRNGILVLAMVPAIQSGAGPNFALPLGIVCGLLAEVLAIEFGLTGFGWLITSSLMAVVIAGIVGYAYGRLMNAVKGAEMTIATYVGLGACGLMSLVWLMAPFQSSNMRWFIGGGLRETIQLDAVSGAYLLDNIFKFEIAGVTIPTGLILVFFFLCFLVWLFFRSKHGIAISAGGINPMFAKSTGLNIDRNRVLANMLSTILAALGIIVFAQSFGYTQLYTAPLWMAFPAVAAVLIGGATAQRAKVSHVIIGTLIFNGLLTTAAPVFNNLFVGTDLSDIMRKIIQNGIILYALTQVKGVGK